eukprot:CAMPEP_0197014258 /NCGR_PEP_ID=MMETSP1380-20130617/69581_1 /TAXON_ID=5936 /ORGANISM="Euplotes crassus, Strain CT5" /LENGTH=173 /DNA_ID=CAMNT_0042439137 /DNA_START=526 /DNA_END=1044 /DNA_ORIENTATION=+
MTERYTKVRRNKLPEKYPIIFPEDFYNETKVYESEQLNTDPKRDKHKRIIRDRICVEAQNTRITKRTKSLGLLKDAVYITNKKAHPGATDSMTNKDTSTKITANKNPIFESVKYMLGTPRMTKSQPLIAPEAPTDPNYAAMEALKYKLKHFLQNQDQVVLKLKKEIEFLRQEN